LGAPSTPGPPSPGPYGALPGDLIDLGIATEGREGLEGDAVGDEAQPDHHHYNPGRDDAQEDPIEDATDPKQIELLHASWPDSIAEIS
jgi:hypothetical protein